MALFIICSNHLQGTNWMTISLLSSMDLRYQSLIAFLSKQILLQLRLLLKREIVLWWALLWLTNNQSLSSHQTYRCPRKCPHFNFSNLQLSFLVNRLRHQLALLIMLRQQQHLQLIITIAIRLLPKLLQNNNLNLWLRRKRSRLATPSNLLQPTSVINKLAKAKLSEYLIRRLCLR